MKLTTKTRYGTRAMLDLTLYQDSGLLSSKEIAEHQDVSVKYLEHLLTTLRNSGLVRTMRGAQGGHALARPPEEINLREIFESLEGSSGLVECTTSPGICERSPRCVTRDVWARMYAACLEVLESMTLAELAEQSREKEGSLTSMYYI